MTAKTIRPLSDDPSKLEEIEWLETVANSVPADSYLKNFFYKDLVTWASEQIRNDFRPFIWDYYKKEQKDALEASLELSKQKARLDEESARAKNLQSDFSHVSQCLREFKETANRKEYELLGQIGTLSSQVSYLKDERDELIAIKDAEIVRLKAEIYDLEHGKK